MALALGAAAIATTFHTKFMEAGVQRAEFGGVPDMVVVQREGGGGS